MRLPLLWMVAVLLPAQSLEDARMHRGDDMRWADPAFDDSGWETVGRRRIRLMEDAKENRFWLRIRVTVPAGEPAAVLVYRCPCEVYLNGIRLGATGDLNAARPQTREESTIFPVPAALAGRSVVLAARLYRPPGHETALGLILWTTIRLLPVREVVRVAAQIQEDVEFPFVVRSILMLLSLGGLLAAIGQRSDRLILGMLCAVCSQMASTAFVLSNTINGADRSAWLWLVGIGYIPSMVFLQWQLAGMPVRRTWGAALLGAFLAIRTPFLVGLFLGTPQPWTPLAASAFLVPYFIAIGMAAYGATRGWGRSSRPVRFLMAAVVTTLAINLISRLAGQDWIPGLQVPPIDVVVSLAFTVLATTYIVRTGRQRRAEQERLRSEMESAQTVQALLLNQAMPAEVHAVYLPATEVGGDFYQAFATPAGTLLVVGDVSGKGLQAAMRVSAIVGALRNRRSDEPAAVLAELNAVLLGSPGFTTCCCALFPPGGAPARVANAGHPAPYVDGVELESESGLPLGVVSEATYPEQAATGSVFTFVSDGVVEAENAQRELFGFDRTREISTKSAREIAEAAKAWGQNDDITVVTVRRSGA